MAWPDYTLYPVANPDDMPFIVNPTGGHAGGIAFQAGRITHLQTSSAVFTVPESGGQLTLWYRVSSEQNYDFLILLVNGTQEVHTSGEGQWIELTRTFNGGDTITARYNKDDSVNTNADTAWLEWGTWTPAIVGQVLVTKPSGLGAKMVKIFEPFTQVPLQQYLNIWLNADPLTLKISLQIDDGTTVETAFTWENPNGGMPAILKVAQAELPQDGFTHQITLRAWQATENQTSGVASLTITDQLPTPPVPIPEWIGPRLIRQNSTELPDLVEINWRASTAVVVFAQLRKQETWRWFTARLGIADRDETRLLSEGVGVRFHYPNEQCYPVYFGVAGIRGGRESPIRWCETPLLIQASDGKPDDTVITPDTIAGTARELFGRINDPNYYTDFSLEIRDAVLAQLGTLPANGNTIIYQAIYRLFLKLKDVVRKGGTVTLANLGTFGVSWTNPRTIHDKVTGVETVSPGYRQPTFAVSPGYKAGTRNGTIMTDEQAKAL